MPRGTKRKKKENEKIQRDRILWLAIRDNEPRCDKLAAEAPTFTHVGRVLNKWRERN